MKVDPSTHPQVVSIEGPISPKIVRSMKPNGPIDQLDLSTDTFCSVKIAREISSWHSVRKVNLYCTASKAAVRQFLGTPGLEEIYICDVHQHSSLQGMPKPITLRTFRCPYGLSGDDVIEISKLPNLTTLSIRSAHLSGAGVEAVINMKKLTYLDFEATNLNDEMAATLASSSKIVALEIGGTQVGAIGLRSICKMTQLEWLDIWALDIQETDLELLAALPNLEYLSVGGYDEQTALTARGVLPRLAAIPSLKRLLLDGIPLTKREISELNERYEKVQIV